MRTITTAAIAALVALSSPALAQKPTLNEIMKPYDAKPQPDYAPPASTPSESQLPRALTSECRCIGCGCKGGVGWRHKATGQCVSRAEMRNVSVRRRVRIARMRARGGRAEVQ